MKPILRYAVHSINEQKNRTKVTILHDTGRPRQIPGTACTSEHAIRLATDYHPPDSRFPCHVHHMNQINPVRPHRHIHFQPVGIHIFLLEHQTACGIEHFHFLNRQVTGYHEFLPGRVRIHHELARGQISI